MPEARIGRQTPTRSYVLPYSQTDGGAAAELYAETGREAQEWQQLLIYDMLARNEDDLWTHTKFGYSVPRRNGKNEVVAMREMYGLVCLGEHILHTAHRTTTTHSAWERLLDLLEKAEIEITSSYRAYGKEHIQLENGGKIEFRTRTSKGGLGEGFDLLIIDEAQEYQDDQETALKYVVTDSRNPQTIFTGTPPTAVSSGTIFPKYRDAVLAGRQPDSAWAEWSVEFETDPNNKDAWYETNPSLGTVLRERSVLAEVGGDNVDFNIQRLGLWLKYNQKSEISRTEWEVLSVKTLPELTGKLFVGIKYSQNSTVSMSIAVKIADGGIFVESIDCRSKRDGDAWILKFLEAADVAKVVVDGAAGQNNLAEKMRQDKLQKPLLPTVREVITANAAFEEALFAAEIRHRNQPALTQAVSNCEKRAIGTNGGFGYRSLREGVDISLMDSVILAHWAAVNAKKPSPQKISY